MLHAKFQDHRTLGSGGDMGHNSRKCPFRQNFNHHGNKIYSIEKCFDVIAKKMAPNLRHCISTC